MKGKFLMVIAPSDFRDEELLIPKRFFEGKHIKVDVASETKEKAKLFAKLLKEKGLGTKNVPDAIDWHFAGTWAQIFHDFDEYKGKELSQVWKT